MDYARVKPDSELHNKIFDLAVRINEAIPDDVMNAVVISALFYLIRLGMGSVDKSKRIEAFDAWVNGVRTDILNDMEGSGTIS